jgi:hypothetical protein
MDGVEVGPPRLQHPQRALIRRKEKKASYRLYTKRLVGGNPFIKSRISYRDDDPLKSQAIGRATRRKFSSFSSKLFLEFATH